MSNGSDEFGKHQHQKGKKMKSGKGLRCSFKVTCQTPKARRPSKATLDDPPAWQKNKALLGFWQFDHDQLDARLVRRLLRFVTGIALVNIGNFNRVSSHCLHLLGKFFDLRSFLFIGWRNMQSQKIT